jgi:hypothetical protein
MAIQINIPLTDRAGFTVPSGSYCALDIHISLRKNIEIEIRFFKDKDSFDNLADAFTPNNAGLLQRYTKGLSNAEYAAFTNTAVHQFVQTYLETIFGVGTTQLVQ